MNVIDDFRADYFFLSNFYEIPGGFTFHGIRYNSSEAAFQSMKVRDDAERRAFTRMTASEAKARGRKVNLRPDWEEIKDEVMYEIVKEKFTQNPELRDKLLATGDAELIEGNWWNDFYWGVCRGTGKNKLGLILMCVRREIREGIYA